MLIEWNHLQVIIYLDFYGYFTQSGGVKGQAMLIQMADFKACLFLTISEYFNS